jgi:hypothetical protein
MTEISLTARIEKLEAIEAIRNLKARYCKYCDLDYDPDALALLFTEDAIWDAGSLRGVFEGREAIRAFFSTIPEKIPYAAHLITNPLIEVEAGSNHASGHWRMLMPCTLRTREGNVAAFQVAVYEEEYRRIDGRWLFAHLKVRLHRMVVPATEWIDLDTASG